MREWIVSEEELGVDGAYYSGKELVRCKDCRFRNTLFCGMQHYEYDDDFQLYMSDDWTNDDGFCYWGERRENNV